MLRGPLLSVCAAISRFMCRPDDNHTTDIVVKDDGAYDLDGVIDFSVDNVGAVDCVLFTYRTLAAGEQYVDTEPSCGGVRVGAMKIKFGSGVGTKKLIVTLHRSMDSKTEC